MWSAVETGAEAPCSRAKHSATLVGGYVYVMGGRGASGALPLKDLWRYGLGSGRWERVAATGVSPPALQEHSAVARGRRLYIFGGEAGAHPTETPLWLLDTETLLWRKVGAHIAQHASRARTAPAAEGPRGRRGHSAHALPDCMLVYGGYRDLRGSTDELWAFHYDTETWQRVRTACAGPARHRHAGTLHDGRLYVHGGMCDLRDCADLWCYDTRSRRWRQVRTPAKLSPSARSGHACVRAGAHIYIFGGECDGRPTDELWRFHFGSETWERVAHQLQWPAARVDACALLVSEPALASRTRSAPTGGRVCPPPPAGLLREITKLSQFHLRRAARCSYTVLAADRDSTESLAAAPASPAGFGKSRSAYAIDGKRIPVPREADEAERVPSDTEGERAPPATRVEVAPRRNRPMAKSASVRFCASSEEEWSTSEYASAEWGDRAALAFSNPHYEGGGATRRAGALTPDSGVAMAPVEIELRELSRAPAVPPAVHTAPPALHLLVVGGKEMPHAALLSQPLTLWAYRLL